MTNKEIVALFVFFLLAFPVLSQHTEEEKDYVVGRFYPWVLEQEEYADWYKSGFYSYTPDEQAIKTIKKYRKKDINIKIIMAFWCDDSKNAVPKIMRILDEAKWNEDEFKLFGVNEDKIANFPGFHALEISVVPTVIIYRGFDEIGRIQEYPKESWEKDIAKIIDKHFNPKDYQ